ncbi:MAG: hypothetical protein A2854_04995 [Parcubacteria group bacterium RIFCSPHIGHO2_01_FULL_56_18]|nr:MAG: hypothetical protein A2854_04995 [Parcubacteria group bacterium RIFCSPHIGHO2_01_FULL_56_18]
MDMRHLRFIALTLLTPLPLFAQAAGGSDTVIFGLRAAIGFFGAIAFIVFLTGFIIYLTRLGTERRADGIKIMEKGVSVVIVVIVATGVLRWLEG